jgi:hypothetical protein
VAVGHGIEKEPMVGRQESWVLEGSRGKDTFLGFGESGLCSGSGCSSNEIGELGLVEVAEQVIKKNTARWNLLKDTLCERQQRRPVSIYKIDHPFKRL